MLTLKYDNFFQLGNLTVNKALPHCLKGATGQILEDGKYS